MEAIFYTAQMMLSVKEPVRFKLNTGSPNVLSLLVSITTIYRVSSEKSIQPIVNKKKINDEKDC